FGQDDDRLVAGHGVERAARELFGGDWAQALRHAHEGLFGDVLHVDTAVHTAGDDGCADGAGAQDGGADAVALCLHAEGLGDGDDGVLGGGVGALVKTRDEASDGGCIQNVS